MFLGNFNNKSQIMYSYFNCINCNDNINSNINQYLNPNFSCEQILNSLLKTTLLSSTIKEKNINLDNRFQTPDSPMWLLSRGRTDESKQTLGKLRGGASEENCIAEFQDMVHYTSEINLNNNNQIGKTHRQ